MTFTVGIPTLQRANAIRDLIDIYESSDVVGEILIVNNSSNEFTHRTSKVRVMDQSENIFVNPAWNLIAGEARFPNLILSNDDILFDPRLLRDAAKFMSRHRVGLLGPHPSSFVGEARRSSRFTPIYNLSHGYGTLLFLRRADFAPIPPDFRIWYGDDWLFRSQARRNWTFRGHPIQTAMGETSSSPEFATMWMDETARFQLAHTPTIYGRRFRHEARVFEAMVRARDLVLRLR